jgi:hypothetical protein
MSECALRQSIITNALTPHDTVNAPMLPRARDPSRFTGDAKDDVHTWIEEVNVYLTIYFKN